MAERSHGGLYAFDKSDQAKAGYILVFPAQANPSSSRIDVRHLANVKAIVVLESMSYGHTYSPEQHLVGYLESTAVPLLSIYRTNVHYEWQALNGYSSDDKTERIPSGIIRTAPAGKLFSATTSSTLGLIHTVPAATTYTDTTDGPGEINPNLSMGQNPNL